MSTRHHQHGGHHRPHQDRRQEYRPDRQDPRDRQDRPPQERQDRPDRQDRPPVNNGPVEIGSGYLEISEKGFGFLRSAQNHFQPKPSDIFVTPDTIKKNFLREGCLVSGPTQPPHRGTSPQLREVDSVNGMPFNDYTRSIRFENLTTIDPQE